MKKFLIRLIIVLIPLAVLVAIHLLLRPYFTGDFGMMSKIVFLYDETDLRFVPKTDNFVEVDSVSKMPTDSNSVLVIGDSFATQDGVSIYPDILASLIPDTEVFNFNPDKNNLCPIAKFVNLYNRNLIKSKVVILETVERAAPYRLGHADLSEDTLTLEKHLPKISADNNLRSYVTEFQDYYYKKVFSGHSSTLKAKLSKPMFTSKFDEDNLYFYFEDTIHYSDWLLNRAAEVLDTLYQMAEAKDIRLIFAICPDKSHIYKDYIVDNQYNFNDIYPFFERFEGQYKYIDVKKLIKPYIDKGELDMYLANDTHWSSKSAKIFAEELKKCVEYQINH